MHLGNKTELIQSQKLVITTEIKQSLSILNMSKLELEEEIKKEIEENPLLEAEKKGEIDWEEYIRSMDNKRYDKSSYNLDNEITLENIVKSKGSLYDYIKEQLVMYKLNNKDKEICEYIIDCLDEYGYLDVDEEFILNEFSITQMEFNQYLKKIQFLEPSGIGARCLEECLIIQINNRGLSDKILERIINEDLKQIASNKIKEISKKYSIGLEECIEYINIIKELDPKPGRVYSNEKSLFIQPDAIVKKIGEEFQIFMNDNGGFSLSINNYYKSILKNDSCDDEAKEFVKDKLNSAAGLMKNIESRKSTILKIAEEIVNQQKEFFIKGPSYIKPMKLKDIAQILGYHESTISRGVNFKYMLTPYGLYDFKYFFSTSIQNENEEDISTTKIKKLIEEMIDKENKLKPLSDDNISKELKKEGINVARRTIAKYRESMDIPSSSKRKQFIINK